MFLVVRVRVGPGGAGLGGVVHLVPAGGIVARARLASMEHLRLNVLNFNQNE